MEGGMKRVVFLANQRQREFAKRLIDQAEEGEVMRLGKPARTEDQNDKLHPMIRDIQRQVPGMETFSEKDIRLRFLNALGTELRFLPVLEGEGAFPVGLSSAELTKDQFSALIELIYAYGAKHGVRWTDPMEQAA
jgi:hypothetical protein